MKSNTVRILLATYNGEAFVRAMIDSVLQQDHKDIEIILSDDCSKDETPVILDQYAKEYPDTITHYRSGLRFGCAQKHFMHLLRKFGDADYIMFCDQDDVWHPDKVTKTLEFMRSVETGDIPAMVHTDLRVVDRQLNEIAPSFCDHSALVGDRLSLNQLLVQNVVTGCTMMINRKLAALADRDCDMDKVLMHDWWLAMLASVSGKAAFLDEATIDYRQHGKNSVGAEKVYSPKFLWKRLRSSSMHAALQAAALQASAFMDCYSDLLSEEERNLLTAFSDTYDMSLFKRNRIYLKYDLLKSGFVRKTIQLLGW